MVDFDVIDNENDIWEERLPDVSNTPAYSYHYYEETIPYEILLSMCRKGEIDIMKIYLSDITDKFIKYIETLPKRNYDVIANFIAMAGALIEYKSAMLLPRPEMPEDNEDWEIEGAARKMMFAEEYGMFQDISEKLGAREILNRFYREPMFSERDYNVIIKDFNAGKMISAFENLMHQKQHEERKHEAKVIMREDFTVQQQEVELVEAVRAYKMLSFFDWLGKDAPKNKTLHTFLALLNILKAQVATADQAELNGDIILKHSASTDNYNADESEMYD
jgi:segregation and condensation protein A